jgi:hypothetical protein
LGGTARSAGPGVYAFVNPPGIETIGTDNNWWCNYHGNVSWSGWQRC